MMKGFARKVEIVELPGPDPIPDKPWGFRGEGKTCPECGYEMNYCNQRLKLKSNEWVHHDCTAAIDGSKNWERLVLMNSEERAVYYRGN
jgi:hypothetical protein